MTRSPFNVPPCPFGSHTICMIVGDPLRLSIRPVDGVTDKAGCESFEKALINSKAIGSNVTDAISAYH